MISKPSSYPPNVDLVEIGVEEGDIEIPEGFHQASIEEDIDE